MLLGRNSTFGGIVHNEFVRGLHQKAHSRESEFLHRIWNLIFGLISFGLGIALVFSCYSPKTTDINLYTVQPLYFLRDFVANSSYATQNSSSLNYTTFQNYSVPTQDPNAPFVNYPELQYNSSVNFSSLGLPDFYYFGISGVCKKWANSTTTCNRKFPPSLDIPLAILQDLKNTTNTSNLAADLVSGHRQDYSAPSKAASALMVTAVIWTVIIIVIVQIIPTSFLIQIVPLLLMLALALSAWAVYNEIFFTQAAYYSVDLKVMLRQNNAIVLGAGFWVFIAYAICTLLITPVTAFWSVICFLTLVTIAVVLAWLFFVCLLAMIASAGGGKATNNNNYYGGTYPGNYGGDGGDGGY